MLYTKLWFILRDAFWGKNIGRARQALVKGILAISLLGGTAVWAKPKTDTWLEPPEPPKECTDLSVVISNDFSTKNLNNAKLWVGELSTAMTGWGFIWNTEQERLEYWITDGIDTWKIEVVCFDATPTHYIVFGEFDKISFADAATEIGY